MIFPERHGLSWTNDEIYQVIREYKAGHGIKYLADKHKRTIRSIEYLLHKEIGTETSDIVINEINFTEAINVARRIVFNKIELNCMLKGVER